MNSFSKSKPGVCSLFIAMITLSIVSCNNTPEGSVNIPVPNDSSALGKINHFIPQDTIALFQRAFASERDSIIALRPGLFIPTSEAFNKPAILEALKDPKCVGIRIYYGVKKGGDRNEIRMMLVGVDAEGKDLYISEGGLAAKAATQVSGGRSGGSEYGQCVPPCK